jgi:hypothetical protein
VTPVFVCQRRGIIDGHDPALAADVNPKANALRTSMRAICEALDDLRHRPGRRERRLDPKQTPLHQAVIIRAGRPCGLFFQVQGPRRVRTDAVWSSDEGRVLFYDPAGRRFAETRLS